MRFCGRCGRDHDGPVLRASGIECQMRALGPLQTRRPTLSVMVAIELKGTSQRIAKHQVAETEVRANPPWHSNATRPAGYRSARANVATGEPPGQAVLIHPFDDRPGAAH